MKMFICLVLSAVTLVNCLADAFGSCTPSYLKDKLETLEKLHRQSTQDLIAILQGSGRPTEAKLDLQTLMKLGFNYEDHKENYVLAVKEIDLLVGELALDAGAPQWRALRKKTVEPMVLYTNSYLNSCFKVDLSAVDITDVVGKNALEEALLSAHLKMFVAETFLYEHFYHLFALK